MAVNQEELFKEVLRLLLATPSDQACQQDVRDLFHSLGRRKCQNFAIRSANDLTQDLEECSRLFEVRGQGSDAIMVAPKTSLTICPMYSNKSESCPEGTCPDLHFCAFFLLSGQCSYGDHCHFSHELRTRHNQKMLERHLLGGLPITELRKLFCLPAVRQGVTLPRVCWFYNQKRGCTKGVECNSLHLCHFYVLDQCKFGRRCDRNHDIDNPQVMRVLTLYGVKVNRNIRDVLHEVREYNRKLESELDMDGQERPRRPMLGAGAGGARSKRFGSVPNLSHGQQFSAMVPEHEGSAERARKRPRNASESSQPNLTTPKMEEICLFHLKGACQFGENCRQLHSPFPFLWRLIPADERGDWEGVAGQKVLPSDSSLTLEKAYSQPQETSCIIIDENGDEIVVQFHSMSAKNRQTGQRYTAQHICTPSAVDPFWTQSVAQRHHDTSLATVWLWYWKNKDDVWQEFGLEENGSRLPVTSAVVEEKFLSRNFTPFSFDHFVLDFSKKRLKNTRDNCKFKVQNRPKFVPTNDAAEADASEMYRSDSDASDKERGADRDGYDDDDDEAGKDDEARASHDVAVRNEEEDSVRGKHVPAPPAASVDGILKPLLTSSREFLKTKRHFVSTLGVACTVLGISKVDNPRLEARYKRARKNLKKRSRRDKGKETLMLLYYGLSPDEDVNAICTNGINRNNFQATVSGTSPVKGGYFHVNAARAKSNVGRENEERQMLVVKCCLSSKELGLGVQPSDPGGRPGWNDDVYDPKTFLVSDPSQVCPTYLITYQVP